MSSILEMLSEQQKDEMKSQLSLSQATLTPPLDSNTEQVIRQAFLLKNIIEDNFFSNCVWGCIAQYVDSNDLPDNETEAFQILSALSDYISNELNENVPEDRDIGLGHAGIVIDPSTLIPRPKNIYTALLMCSIDKAEQYNNDYDIEMLNCNHQFKQSDLNLLFKHVDQETFSFRKNVSDEDTNNQIVKIAKLDYPQILM
jgi:hypothetical protein